MDSKLKDIIDRLGISARVDGETAVDTRLSWFDSEDNFIGRFTDSEGWIFLFNILPQ